MKKVLVATCVLFLCTSCFAGPNPLENVPNENGQIANGWNGLWDGLVLPISFVVSLFNHNVEIYNPNSNGWYAFGFIMGAGAALGSSASVSTKK